MKQLANLGCPVKPESKSHRLRRVENLDLEQHSLGHSARILDSDQRYGPIRLLGTHPCGRN